MSPIGVGKTRTNKAKQTLTPKLWLLLIGVNQYLDEDLPSLRYSALDCRGLSEALEVACQQFSQMEMTTFHDFGLQLPLLGDVREKLAEIKVNAKPEDTVLFYFSGHGVIDSQTQQTFLCLRDTQKDDLTSSAIALQDLLSILGSCAARQQLVWLDACHSGGMTLRGAVIDIMLNPTRQLVRDLQTAAASSKGFYALLSCDTDQQSWEFPELGHGVFTYYLMRGLRGEAADSQGMVTADGLYRYVYHQTLQYLDKTNQQLRLINQQRRGKGDTNLYSEYPLQTPKRIVEGIGEIVLGNKLVIEDEKRVALVVDGITSSQTLALSKVLQGSGGFELEYLPRHGKASVTDIRDAIQGCLAGGDTALLYLRGRLEETPGGESALVLADDVWLSCSWLRQRLRRALVGRVILILDCPQGKGVGGKSNKYLESWVEDLDVGGERRICIIAASAPEENSEFFIRGLVETLQGVSPDVGLSAAGWISLLQVHLAGSLPLQVWLSGMQGVIEVIPTGWNRQKSASLDLGICPYLGLRAFTEDDFQYFYGRSALIQQLISHVASQSFLAVVGASGSGKSSAVQAGMISRLRFGQELAGSEKWLIHCLRPGNNPLDILARKLGGEKEASEFEKMEGLLYQGVEGLVYWLRSRPEPMVMLVIDQFEELFTLASDEDREKFLKLIFGALEYAGDKFKLVITLRADFMTPCLEIPAMAKLLQESSVLVPAKLSDDDYRSVIVKPAEQVGLRVESGLVEVLLQELNHSAGDLPLLEFVLEELWSHRKAGELTLLSYQQHLGGIAGALERKAEAVYGGLDELGKECARWIFLSLTQLGEGTEDTRRRIFKSELVVKKFPQELVDKTLQILTAAKLIVVNVEEFEEAEGKGRGYSHKIGDLKLVSQKVEDQNPLSSPCPLPPAPLHDSVTIEVAHEILIRHWSTLRWWLEENRSRVRSHRQIEQATRLWIQGKEATEFLLQGVRLAEAEDIFIKYTDELSSDVWRFISACLDQRQLQEKAQKKRLRQTQAALAVISVLGITATGFGGFAFFQRQSAQLREVSALNSSSEALLLSHRQIEALIAGMEAGKRLKQVFHPDNNLELATIGTLQQAVFKNFEVNRLLGHTNKINAVDVSFDGNLLASASDDGNVKLWGKEGNLLASFSGDTERVLSLDFSDDGKFLVVGGGDRKIKMFSLLGENNKILSSPKLIQEFTGHTDFITTVIFTDSAKSIISASRDGTIKIWDINGKLTKSWIAHKGWVNSLDVSHDGKLIVSAGEDGLIKLWQVSDRKLVKEFLGNKSGINHVSFNPDNKLIAASTDDGVIKLWNLSGKELQAFDTGEKQVKKFRFSADEKIFVVASSEGNIKILNIEGKPLLNLQGHQAQVNDIHFTPDGKSIISVSDDKTVRIWNLPAKYPQQTNSIYSVSFNPQNNTFATAGWDKKVSLYNLEKSGKIQFSKTLATHDSIISQVKFSPDGKLIATASADKNIKLWNIQTGTLIQTLKGHQNKVTNISFHPNNQTIISASSDKTIKTWQLSNGKLLNSFTAHNDEVSSINYSPDGKIIASGGNTKDPTIKLWHPDGTLMKILPGHGNAIPSVGGAIASLIFSPDSNTLASASWDNTIKIWHLPDGKLMHTLIGHSDGVTSLNFTPDGQILASASADATIKFWDVSSGNLIKTLSGNSDPINSIAFSNDGKTLVSGGENLGISSWNLNLDQLISQAYGRIKVYLKNNK